MLTDNYLIINNDLRVTPYHRIYSNGEWIHACELEIGVVFFDSNQQMNYQVESIEKVYEKQPVYDCWGMGTGY